MRKKPMINNALATVVLLLTGTFGSAAELKLQEGWKIKAGDDPAWSEIDQEASRWESIKVGRKWEVSGIEAFRDYDGFAWYRCRFVMPDTFRSEMEQSGGAEGDCLILSLGSIDDADETFFNGKLVGAEGSMPPNVRIARKTPRNYKIPFSQVKWGAENVIAVRVYDKVAHGGIYERVPSIRPARLGDFVGIDFDLGDDGVFHTPAPAQPKVKVTNHSKRDLDFTLDCVLQTDHVNNAKTIDTAAHTVTVAKHSERWTDVSLTPKAPGFYRFVCRLKQDDSVVAEKSLIIGYDPDQMTTPLTREDDFDAFWQKRKLELAEIEPRFKMTQDLDQSTDDFDVYLVEMYSYGNVLVRGWYSVPTHPGPHPAIMNVPGFFSTMYPMLERKGVATFALNPRGHGNSRDDISPSRDQYLSTGLDANAPENYIYVGAFMDCLRAIDFLASRSEIDPQRIGVEGTSQGGGLSLATAALDPRIALCMADIPFLCNWEGYAEAGGWFGEADAADRLRIMSYTDAMNLAPWIKCPVVMSIGLQDPTCPPRTSYAAFNNIVTEKSCYVYPFGGHSVGTAHRRLKDSWVNELAQNLRNHLDKVQGE